MGLGTDISEWENIITPLARKYKVLAFDNRGAGRSDMPDEPYSIRQMASDVAGVMRTVGFEPAVLLGISMGGAIALALTLDNPELVKKLLLVSTAPRFINRRRINIFGIMRRLPIFVSKYPQPNFAFVRQHSALRAFDCTKRLSELKLPVAILHGRKDGTVPLYLSEEMHTRIKGSAMQVFNGGHLFLLLRQREEFLGSVEKFIG